MAQVSSKHIIIAGDAPVQLFLYPSAAESNPNSYVQRPRAQWFHVGADLLAQLLHDGLKNANPQVHIHKPVLTSPEQGTIHSIVELDAHKPASQDSQCLPTFKLRRVQQIDTVRRWRFPDPPASAHSPSSVSIAVFQETKTETPVPEDSSTGLTALFTQCRPRFLIYHMARPLCNGKIWEQVRRGPLVDAKKPEPDPERLVVVVDADDLRAEGVELSHGLSWEKTCEDFIERLGSVGKLVSLATCAHLVVIFGCAGVIYHRGAQVARPMLLFDPLCVEGEFTRKNLGHVPGVVEAFVAGLAKGLIQSSDLSLEEGIVLGLHAARRLAEAGLTKPGIPPSLGTVYRAPDVMRELVPTEKDKLISFAIPSDDIAGASDRNWSLLDHMIGDPTEVARQIVKHGALSLASQVPLAQFNRLVLFDRHEIESFRTIFNFLREYFLAPMSKPLSIALFGPRGSGKAFAAMQVAEAASKGQRVHNLHFNLAQLTSIDDLLATFHSIRDWSLRGSIPMVYFNAFDISFDGSPFGWLPHLLPVMFSGSFSDHGVSRPIGTAVFFFGATSTKTYEDLRRKAAKSAPDTGNLSRAQEFLACLHGFVNILGPDKSNHGDGADRLYPVRRAVIIRSLLEKREPNLKSGEQINIDDSVLNALLLVPTYRQGIRSLKSIIGMSRLNGRHHFERSALPPQVQLDLHVDYRVFTRYLNGTPLPDELRERLAEQLHNTYLKERDKTATEVEKRDLKPWHETSEELKESSRAHADSIPSKLHEIKCFLAETQGRRTAVTDFNNDQVELLAEMEHDRWNAERLQNQWGKGEERDVHKRKSPFLIPWGDLETQWQDIDRAMVRCYPKILPESHKIYELGPREARMQQVP